MRRLGKVLLTTSFCAAIGLAGCTSDFPGPVIEPGHPAHPDSEHAMAPAPSSPFSLEPPFLPLADDAEMHDMHQMRDHEMPDNTDTTDEAPGDVEKQHQGHGVHEHGGGGS